MKDQEKLEALYAKYFEEVYAFIDDLFEQKIKPWLKKYSLHFVAGNADYFISPTSNTPAWFVRKYTRKLGAGLVVDTDKIDRRIYRLLELEVGGYPHGAGTLMPKFDPEEEKK